jgi:hypothetical protein
VNLIQLGCINFKPAVVDDMTMVGMTSARQEGEENADYRQRMVANLLAVGFVSLLMISGYWVVTTLAG